MCPVRMQLTASSPKLALKKRTSSPRLIKITVRQRSPKVKLAKVQNGAENNSDITFLLFVTRYIRRSVHQFVGNTVQLCKQSTGRTLVCVRASERTY
jgi:hypothetical protein